MGGACSRGEAPVEPLPSAVRPLTPEQVALVQSSWQSMVARHGEKEIGRVFYKRLFELDGNINALFTTDVGTQGARMIAMMQFAVNTCGEMDKLSETLEGLGERHNAIGVTDGESGHYDLFGQALQYTLRWGLGEDYSAEMEMAWIYMYKVLRTLMNRGASRHKR